MKNEVHFVLCCSALSDLRQRFIPDKCYRQPSSFTLALTESSENKQMLVLSFQRNNRDASNWLKIYKYPLVCITSTTTAQRVLYLLPFSVSLQLDMMYYCQHGLWFIHFVIYVSSTLCDGHRPVKYTFASPPPLSVSLCVCVCVYVRACMHACVRVILPFWLPCKEYRFCIHFANIEHSNLKQDDCCVEGKICRKCAPCFV